MNCFMNRWGPSGEGPISWTEATQRTQMHLIVFFLEHMAFSSPIFFSE